MIIIPIFSSNSQPFASELLGNLEEIFIGQKDRLRDNLLPKKVYFYFKTFKRTKSNICFTKYNVIFLIVSALYEILYIV